MAAGAVSMGWTGPSPHSAHGLLLLAATGMLATLAQMAMTRAYAIGRPLTNASLQYLGIVFSFVYGVWLFHDPVTWSALAGMAMIIGAGLIAAWRRAGPAAPLAAPLTLPPAEALPR
jgi:S-adenosylmethionine uptake transporter